jgi:hypothetical protein
LALALLVVPTASAHASVFTSDGRYKVTFGFLNEPAVTYTKTGLDLIITDNATGGPVDGADKTLHATLLYGDKTHDLSLAPQFGTHGRYTDTITLTEPGFYKLHVTGTLNGTTVDVTIPAKEPTPDINDTYFPDHPPSLADLQAQVAALQQQVAALQAKATQQAASTTPVTTQFAPTKAAPAVELVGALAVVGAAAFLLGRRFG